MYRFAYAVISSLLLFIAAPVAAEGYEVTIYSGVQTAPHSPVTFTDELGNVEKFTAGWNGKSMAPPPYYGVRATKWYGNFGFGAELTHAKVYANQETRTKSGFERLEFTDGLNIITANLMWQKQFAGWPVRIHSGLGLGIALPHVDIKGNGLREYGYQMTGGAVRLIGGISYPISDRMSLITEYNGTYSQNDVALDGQAGLKTNVITNAINIGLSLQF